VTAVGEGMYLVRVDTQFHGICRVQVAVLYQTWSIAHGDYLAEYKPGSSWRLELLIPAYQHQLEMLHVA
jgi:hypothetical protein